MVKLNVEETKRYTFLLTQADLEEKYPMCDPQLAQVDCRCEKCRWHVGCDCTNVAPAITLNPDRTFVCWSEETEEEYQKRLKEENE